MRIRYLYQLPMLFESCDPVGWSDRRISWHPNGLPKTITLTDASGACAMFSFARHGQLKSVTSRGASDFVSEVVVAQRMNWQWGSLGCTALRGGTSLCLAGDLVTDAVIERLADCGLLRQVGTLELVETAISLDAAMRLASLRSLHSLRVVCALAQEGQFGDALQVRRGIQVWINGKQSSAVGLPAARMQCDAFRCKTLGVAGC